MKNLKLIVLIACLSAATLSSADYSNKPQVTDFIDLMVNKHQFERQQVLDWLAAAEQQTSIINAMSRPAEKVKPGMNIENYLYPICVLKEVLSFGNNMKQP